MKTKLHISPDIDIKQAVDTYNVTIREVLDKHVPLKTKNVIIRRNTKWFNDQIQKAKVVRRRLERKKDKSGLESDRDAYSNQCRYAGFLIDTAKTLSLKNSVCETKYDIKQLFKTTKKILTWKPSTVLPEARPDSALPSMFSEYFVNKIVKINADITSEIGKAAVSEIETILCAESVFFIRG